MGTKGGNCYRLKGKHLSVSLVAIIGTTILLWAWEKTPLVTTLLSAQDQFVMPSSETLVGVADPLLPIRPKEYSEEDSSVRETKNEQTEDDSSNVVMSVETKSGQTMEDSSDIILSGETKSEQTEEDSSDIKPKSHILETPHATISGETKSEQTEEDSSDIKPKEDIDETPHAVISEETNSKQIDEDPLDIKPKEDIQETPQVMSGETKSEQIEERLDVALISSVTVTSHKKGEDDKDLTTASVENKACNYAKGKWVADGRRPLYSGFGCKQWLSPMWACKLTQRTDFSYEAIRWQPENCKMPEFERMTFLKRMQDRTIAFVGDSLGRQQFQSLMCMASGGEESPEVEDIGRQYGLVKARGAKRPDGWAYRFPSSNTTILYYWSATLCDLEPLNITDPSTDIAMHLDRPAAFLRKYLHRFDVLVLNTGHHWNRGKLTGNRWVMYVGGVPNTDRKRAQIGNAKNFTVYSVANWVDVQLRKHPRLKAFFRTISPRHFVNGDWNTGGSCDNTSPLAGGSEVSQDESSDPVVADAVKNTKVKILDITAISQLRDEGHISRYSIRAVEGMQDCLHWCLPGIPDTWNELLVAQI